MGALIELNSYTLLYKGKLPSNYRQIAADCHHVMAKCGHMTGISLKCPGTSTGGRSYLISRILRCQALSHDVIASLQQYPLFLFFSIPQVSLLHVHSNHSVARAPPL